MKYKILRPTLWFCKNDIVEQDKFDVYFTGKALEELIKYGYVESTISVKVLRFDRRDYISSNSTLTEEKTIVDFKENIFKKFYEDNNRLRYCNGSYYDFADADIKKEYREWYNGLPEHVKFNMYYGDGFVD